VLRKIILLAGLSVAFASSVWAQDVRVEITPFVGYTFSEGFNVDPVRVGGETFTKVNPVSAVSYGVSLGFFVTEDVEVGFQFAQQGSVLEAKGTTTREFANLKVNNYHATYTYHFNDWDDALRPFLFGGLGATQYAPGDIKGYQIDGKTRFSSTWGGGLKVYVGQFFGFKLVGRWTPTYIKSEPAGIWCSPYWPWSCYQLTESDYSNQLELAGGIVFRF
jgi:hypothetical protein